MATKVEIDNPAWSGFCAVLGAFGAICLLSSLSTCSNPTDSTDVSKDKRSGMSLQTDALTGCQYLGTGFALTPRMDGTGHQICRPTTPKDSSHD